MYVVIKAMLSGIASCKFTLQIHGGTTSMSTVIVIPPPELVRIKFFDFFLLMFPDAKGELESFIMTHH